MLKQKLNGPFAGLASHTHISETMSEVEAHGEAKLFVLRLYP